VAKKIFFGSFHDFLASAEAGFNLKKAGIKEKFLIPGIPDFRDCADCKKYFDLPL
jgi:hypothetical protein